MLQFAMELALRSHRGQYRKDGRPYALHPFNVISRLANWDIDDEITLSAAALHDVEEENPNKRYLIDFISMYPLGPNDAAKEVYRIVLEELTFIPDHPQSTEKILLPDIFSLRHHDMISLPTVANAEVFVYALPF